MFLDSFFIEYRDPMFGIILLLSLVFIIAFVNYWWGVFKSKEEKQSIEQFIKRFEIAGDENETRKLLDEFAVPTESLGLLAHSYTKSGDFEKAIGIYLLALKRVKSRNEKQYILSELGKTYFKAGFLRRSSEVFLESLHLFPRNETSLKYLTVSYEKLKEYDRALEVLDALEEMEVDVKSQKAYVKARQILSDASVSNKVQLEVLEALREKFPLAERMIVEFWQKWDIEIDNNKMATFDPKNILDLLWYMPRDVLDFSVLKAPLFQAVARAKGVNVPQSDAGVFELDILGTLQESGYKGATLSFEYTCSGCKQTFPVHFYRCPSCHALGSVGIEPIITKERFETDLPF